MKSVILLGIFVLATTAPVQSSFSFPAHYPFARLNSALAFLHPILTRVSNLRANRGDTLGSQRAKTFAEKIEHAQRVGVWKLVWSFGWDYARNYAWRRDFNYRDLYAAVSDFGELARALNELAAANSDGERVVWVSRNYERILRISKSSLKQLLIVFKRSGPLKEFVQAVRQEVVDGDLLRDMLQVGRNDLKGLVEIMQDLVSQLNPSHFNARNSDDEL